MSEPSAKIKEYSNGEVTIVWNPDLCIHSANCVGGLPAVFNSKARPWINAQGAGTEAIIAQVKKCPSGALSYYLNAEKREETTTDPETAPVVEVTKNGPLRVHGDLIIRDSQGVETRRTRVTAFCRCGGSGNKPFCDGSHRNNGFQG